MNGIAINLAVKIIPPIATYFFVMQTAITAGVPATISFVVAAAAAYGALKVSIRL